MTKPKRNLKLAADQELVDRAPDSVEFEAAYGERFADTLDLNTWTLGEDLAAAFGRIEQEVAEALKKEDEYRDRIRDLVFPQLSTAPDAPRNAGVFQAR